MKSIHPLPLLCACLSLLLPAKAADAPRFEKDIAAFEAADQKNPPPKSAILFVGDSTFTRWKSIQEDLPEYTVINRGFGGSRMDDLLHHTDRLIFPYEPRRIVVQEGGNDLHSGRTPEQVVEDAKAFVTRVRAKLPEVPIVFGSLAPSPGRWNEIDARKNLDRLLKEYVATQKNVSFVYFFDAFLGLDGKPRDELFVEDHVHPSPAGYQLRAKMLRPFLGPADKQQAK